MKILQFLTMIGIVLVFLGRVLTAEAAGPLWEIQTVDSSGVGGLNPSITLDDNNKVYISSYVDNASSFDRIRVRTNVSGTWGTVGIRNDMPLAQFGPESSVVYKNGKIYVCYHLLTTNFTAASNNVKRLELFTYDPATASGSLEIVDEGGAGDAVPFVGTYCSLAVADNDKIHITYYDQTNKDIKYANRLPGQAWARANFGSGSNDFGPWNSLALSATGIPYLTYYESIADGVASNRLKYVSSMGTDSATTTVLDGTTGAGGNDVGANNALAIDSDGHAHICYRDAINDTYLYITNESGAWSAPQRLHSTHTMK